MICLFAILEKKTKNDFKFHFSQKNKEKWNFHKAKNDISIKDLYFYNLGNSIWWKNGI